MSAAEVVTEARGEVAWLALDELRDGLQLREGGLDDARVEALAGIKGGWGPILVQRLDRTVIDGAHRVAAARRLGLDRIEAETFDGDPVEAVVEFVRRHAAAGLALTVPDRKFAAARVLAIRPEWSDRRIAEVCGLSPKTVGRVRATQVGRGGVPGELVARVGRDNRVRPLDPVAVRSRIVEALSDQPDASLRVVAASVGVSPETVRLVRMNLRSTTDDEAAPRGAPAAVADPVLALAPRPEAPPPSWDADAALTTCDGGTDFLAWFERTCVDATACAELREVVPLSRIYEIADEARRRAEVWTDFARSLEARSRRS
jgi:ParB-like chromosome segregation protein Spo0J